MTHLLLLSSVFYNPDEKTLCNFHTNLHFLKIQVWKITQKNFSNFVFFLWCLDISFLCLLLSQLVLLPTRTQRFVTWMWRSLERLQRLAFLQLLFAVGSSSSLVQNFFGSIVVPNRRPLLIFCVLAEVVVGRL